MIAIILQWIAQYWLVATIATVAVGAVVTATVVYKADNTENRTNIEVDAEKEDDTLYIRMKDTGVGLPLERREISFKPFITTSLPNPILGTGTGLGLKVVRDILELYGGTARFIDVEKPWKTCIEIVLPDRGASDDN